MSNDSFVVLTTLLLLIVLALVIAVTGSPDYIEDVSDAAMYIIPSF